MLRTCLFIWGLLALLPLPAFSANNLVIVTLDGVRWQEVFRGIDESLIQPDTVSQPDTLKQDFDGASTSEKRRKLMPFLWQTLQASGTIIGNQDKGSVMQVANPWYFSYPGYNELITGQVDNAIDSNDKVPNPNVSFLEWLQPQPGFNKPFGVFASWDVFPAIFNRDRSGLHINAGFESAAGDSPSIALLNTLQQQIPSPWDTVRLDAFTHHFAINHIKTHQPRVMYISLGESDDFAHDGNYAQYIRAIHRSDARISELWDTLQSIKAYKNNTALIITTDHGRGSTLQDWQHHSSRQAILKKYPEMAEQAPDGIVGSQNIWLAAMGADIAGHGELNNTDTTYTLSQVAATALKLLGKQPEQFRADIHPPIDILLTTGDKP